jgi:hypothetical protein
MNRRTTIMLTGMTLLALAIVALPQVGFAQSVNPWIGTWKLNPAKSTYSPGPGPRSQTTTAEAAGQGIRFTLDGINAQGNPAKNVVMTFNDGKFHPVTGAPSYDAQADKVVNESTVWAIRTKAGKVVETLISELSPDGKTWTLTTTGVTPNGQPLSNVVVREKQ